MCKRKREFLGVLILVVGALVGHMLSGFGAFKTIHSHDTQDCTLIRGPVGAEDIQTHNGFAYVSSDDRRQWMSVGFLFEEHEKMRNLSATDQGSIYVLDLKEARPSPRRLPITGNIDTKYFHPHGISLIFIDNELYLYVVSHFPGPDEIRVFRVVFEEGGKKPIELVWLRSLRHPLLLRNANDVHVRSIDGVLNVFITLPGREQQGTWSSVVEMVSQRAWSSILRCRDNKNGFECENFLSDLPFPNGINSSPDGKLLYVALTFSRKVHVYSFNGQLLAVIDLDSGLDNIDVDPNTGDLYVGAHPNILAFAKHKDDAAVPSPSQVLRVRRCNSSEPSHHRTEDSSAVYGQCQTFKTVFPIAKRTVESSFVVDEVYLSVGHETENSISASAVGAYEPLTRSLIVGGVFDDGVVVCRNR